MRQLLLVWDVFDVDDVVVWFFWVITALTVGNNFHAALKNVSNPAALGVGVTAVANPDDTFTVCT